MTGTLETVKVICTKSPDGYRVINKSDMQKTDKEFKAPAKKAAKKTSK